ncbi:MAG: ATP-binding protein [Chloroflexota bacterium]
MSPRRRLRTRLLASHLAVVVVGSATLSIAVGLVAPGAFEAAMGHAADGMGEMMTTLVRDAFQEATRTALVIAVGAAAVAAIAVAIALSARLSRPIGRLARASRRIASGRYAERVPVTSDDEIGDLAASFNTMAASLEATERRRLQLVGDVAHELRTPLATLDGYLEGLEDGVIAPTEATWTLLRGETSRLARLVNDLQELWRAEARQLPMSLTPVDIAGQVRAVGERFAAQAHEREIMIQSELGPEPLMATADAERLGQILDNFVSNAVRYSLPGNRVTLSARAERKTITIGVADEGPGHTPEQLERVFERFYRVDPSRSRALGGSGIGLAIARALAEAMGGHVAAESEGPDQGATFRVFLPMVGSED